MSNHRNFGHVGRPSGVPGQPQKKASLKFNFGHNGVDKVIVVISQRVDNITLTDAEVDDWINCLKQGREELRKHLERAGKNG